MVSVTKIRLFFPCPHVERVTTGELMTWTRVRRWTMTDLTWTRDETKTRDARTGVSPPEQSPADAIALSNARYVFSLSQRQQQNHSIPFLSPAFSHFPHPFPSIPLPCYP
jgi:hypothetical protein